jgi:hypothetical protein
MNIFQVLIRPIKSVGIARRELRTYAVIVIIVTAVMANMKDWGKFLPFKMQH